MCMNQITLSQINVNIDGSVWNHCVPYLGICGLLFPHEFTTWMNFEMLRSVIVDDITSTENVF